MKITTEAIDTAYKALLTRNANNPNCVVAEFDPILDAVFQSQVFSWNIISGLTLTTGDLDRTELLITVLNIGLAIGIEVGLEIGETQTIDQITEEILQQ